MRARRIRRLNFLSLGMFVVLDTVVVFSPLIIMQISWNFKIDV